MTRITGTLHENRYLAKFFVELKVFQTKVVEKSQSTRFILDIFSENRAVYEIVWETVVGPNMPLMTIWRSAETLRFAKARIGAQVHGI
jgi:hypothetical protein